MRRKRRRDDDDDENGNQDDDGDDYMTPVVSHQTYDRMVHRSSGGAGAMGDVLLRHLRVKRKRVNSPRTPRLLDDDVDMSASSTLRPATTSRPAATPQPAATSRPAAAFVTASVSQTSTGSPSPVPRLYLFSQDNEDGTDDGPSRPRPSSFPSPATGPAPARAPEFAVAAAIGVAASASASSSNDKTAKDGSARPKDVIPVSSVLPPKDTPPEEKKEETPESSSFAWVAGSAVVLLIAVYSFASSRVSADSNSVPPQDAFIVSGAFKAFVSVLAIVFGLKMFATSAPEAPRKENAAPQPTRRTVRHSASLTFRTLPATDTASSAQMTWLGFGMVLVAAVFVALVVNVPPFVSFLIMQLVMGLVAWIMTRRSLFPSLVASSPAAPPTEYETRQFESRLVMQFAARVAWFAFCGLILSSVLSVMGDSDLFPQSPRQYKIFLRYDMINMGFGAACIHVAMYFFRPTLEAAWRRHVHIE